MSEPSYPRLSELFGGYMHQDWCYDGEGEDWPDLVRNFLRDDRAADPPAVAAEVDRLLDDVPDDAALTHQLYCVLHCYYDPRPDLGGPTVRKWLEEVAGFLRKGA